MPTQRVRGFLDQHDVKYGTIKHSKAYTAKEVAESAHLDGQQLAKTVVLEVDGDLAMAVLPASFRVELDVLEDAIGAEHVELASEDEFADRFPGCEVGAMPPFGNLYDMDVYLATGLTPDDYITFSAGTHDEVMRLRFEDFDRLVSPRILRFSVPA